MKRGRLTKREKRLAAVIELLAVYYPSGCNVLLGLEPELSPDDWEELIRDISPNTEPVHVQHDNDPDERVLRLISKAGRIPSLVEEVGGWQRINYATNRLMREKPSLWTGFRRYCEIQTAPVSFYTVEQLADQHHVSPSTLWRWKEKVPQCIAHLAISWDGQSTFGFLEKDAI